MGHHTIMLWVFLTCALLSGASAMKSQNDFLKATSEEVFNFHKAAGYRAGFGYYGSPSKHHVHHVKQPLRTSREGNAQVLDSSNEVDAGPLTVSFQIQGKMAGASRAHQIGVIVIGLLLLTCLAAFLISRMEEESPSLADENATRMAKAILQSSAGYPSSIVASSGPPTRSKQMLIDMVESNDGTWTRTYKEATGQQKEALELLFRCGIIPQQEFGRSRISQEHIDECMWISVHMLRQRSLEEWVRLWPEAQRAFEESVTACFSARTDLLDTRKLDMALMDYRQEAPTEAHERAPQLNSSLLQSGPRSMPVAEEAVLSSKDSTTGQNLLIMRCREIMAKNRPDRPWPVQDNVFSSQTVPLPSAQETSNYQQPDTPTSSHPTSGRVIKLRVFEEQLPEMYPNEAGWQDMQQAGWVDVQQDMQQLVMQHDVQQQQQDMQQYEQYEQYGQYDMQHGMQQYDMQQDMEYQEGAAHSSTSPFQTPNQGGQEKFYR